MKVNIYVDGFNLYYGAVKGTPYRWLNVAEMCRLLLPNDQILQIKYFTAKVNPRPTDPDQRNIATHLLTDAFDDVCELAVIVSNDSDLLTPIKVVTQRLGKAVGILNPHKVPSMALLPHAKFVKQIRRGVLNLAVRNGVDRMEVTNCDLQSSS